MINNILLHHPQNEEGAEAAPAAGAAPTEEPTIDYNDPEILKSYVESQKSGLVSKNRELIGRLDKAQAAAKSVAERAQSYDDLIARLGGQKNAEERVQAAETDQLSIAREQLINGDLDWSQFVDGIGQHKVKKIQDEYAPIIKERDSLKESVAALETKIRDDLVQQRSLKVASSNPAISSDPGTFEDIQLWASRDMKFNDDGEMVWSDEDGVEHLGEAAMKEWLDRKLQTRPGWLKVPSGTGIAGAKVGKGGLKPWEVPADKQTDFGYVEAAAKAAREHGLKTYTVV